MFLHSLAILIYLSMANRFLRHFFLELGQSNNSVRVQETEAKLEINMSAETIHVPVYVMGQRAPF